MYRYIANDPQPAGSTYSAEEAAVNDGGFAAVAVNNGSLPDEDGPHVTANGSFIQDSGPTLAATNTVDLKSNLAASSFVDEVFCETASCKHDVPTLSAPAFCHSKEHTKVENVLLCLFFFEPLTC